MEYIAEIGWNFMGDLSLADEMIEAAQSAKKELQALAIEQGLATYAEGKPSELAPTKKEFIERYGLEEFDKVKRIGKPRQYFVWID